MIACVRLPNLPLEIASPLDVHATTRYSWTPFTADSAFGAFDCYIAAWAALKRSPRQLTRKWIKL